MPKGSIQATLVSEQNFLLYTPFLPEAAAGTLEPRHVVTPLREVLKETRLQLGSVTGLDPAARSLTVCNPEGTVRELGYDRLVLAPGSISRALPIPGLKDHAVGFKSLADAIWLRNHIIRCLELAEVETDDSRLDQLLTFVFVGGGYAGLEALAELQDFAVDALDLYPRARLHGVNWMLVEAGGRVLQEIDESLAEYTQRELRGRGIDIRLHTTVEEAGETFVRLSTGETIPTRTLVWTAGVAPNPIVRDLGVPLDPIGRVNVDEQLRVEGHDHIWALGDAAAVPNPADPSRPCPPTAQHAIRQGKTTGRNVAASLGVGATETFGYTSPGQFVNLGRYKAVAKIGNRTLRGPAAWWLARTYHMSQIPGGRRKVRAVADWTVGLPFSRDVAEVGSIGHPSVLDANSARRQLGEQPVPREGG
jgi:NADH dehydrogenase